MLRRDYITEMVKEFASGVSQALARALGGDSAGLEEAERSVADLLEMDPQVALSLEPASLAALIGISDLGHEIATCASYALDRVGLVYERLGEKDLAELRRQQARAVADAFDCDAADLPAPLTAVDAELFGDAGAGGVDVG